MNPEAPSIAFQPLQLSLLAPDPDQVRKHFDAEGLAELGESIKTHGLVEPIVVRPNEAGDGYQIISGERRYRAAKAAGIAALPAVVRADLVGEDVAVLQIIENLQREDLKLPELMAGIKRLVDAEGLEQAAKLLGKSKSWVSKRSHPDRLCAPVQQAVNQGWIEDIEQAQMLSDLYGLASPVADEILADFDPLRANDSDYLGRPTREQLRDALNSAHARAEVLAQQQAEQQARRKAQAEADQQAAANGQTAKPVQPSREQVQKAAKDTRKQKGDQAKALNTACGVLESELTKGFYTALGLKPHRGSGTPALSVNFNQFHEYSPALPATADGVEWYLRAELPLAQIQRLRKAGIEGHLRVSLPDDLSDAELEKLERALPGRIEITLSQMKLRPKALRQVLERLGGKVAPASSPTKPKGRPKGSSSHWDRKAVSTRK